MIEDRVVLPKPGFADIVNKKELRSVQSYIPVMKRIWSEGFRDGAANGACSALSVQSDFFHAQYSGDEINHWQVCAARFDCAFSNSFQYSGALIQALTSLVLDSKTLGYL
jgi:hypothetical protein